MNKRIYSLGNDFISKVTELVSANIEFINLDLFFSHLETEIAKTYFTNESESNLLRILHSKFNLPKFINESLSYPHYINLLITISSKSNYLSDILVKYPEYFYLVSEESSLFAHTNYKAELQRIENLHKSFSGKVNGLKSFQKREILKIAVKDLFNYSSLRETTLNISNLAKNSLDFLFNICLDDEIKNLSLDPSIKENYSIISLGKLGGRELNYSSDVDLIIFYKENIQLKSNLNYQEFLITVIKKFIDASSSNTSNGFLYRIDLRLRPDGKYSPLCQSMWEYLNYYESRGEEWERQMLIKADILSGNTKLYNDFFKYLTPFIYPSLFSKSPLEQIKRMKFNIEQENATEGNIKLASGGIRDIEFTVQALQLLYGGKITQLRTGNTLECIDELNHNKLLSKNECIVLSEAYILYRNIEHFLQLMDNKQTHNIPDQGNILYKLAHHLGFHSAEEFQENLVISKDNVREIFSSVTGNYKKEKSITEIVKFNNPKKAEKDYLIISTGETLLGEKTFDNLDMVSFEKINKNILRFLKSNINPDIVLHNFAGIIKNIKIPSVLFNSMQETRRLKYFLQVLLFNKYGMNLLNEDKTLIDHLISGRCFQSISQATISNSKLKLFLFHLSCLLTIKKINIQKVSFLLSQKLKLLIDQQAKITFSNNEDYLIAGLGSFSNNEMGFYSDVDLVFCVDDENIEPYNEKFLDLVNKVKTIISPFDIDFRLRPEGKSSQLVWHLKNYEDYFKERAQVWEFQTFTKLNFISGSKKIFNKLKNIYLKEVNRFDDKILKYEMSEMRKKLYPKAVGYQQNISLKNSSGGYNDIQFIVQYQLLNNSMLLKQYSGKSYYKYLLKNYDQLFTNYCNLKQIEILFEIIYNKKLNSVNNENDLLLLASYFNFKSSNQFWENLNNILNNNKQQFKQWFS